MVLEWLAKLSLSDRLDQQLNTSPESVLTDAHRALFLSTEMDRVVGIEVGGDAPSHVPVRIAALHRPQPVGSLTCSSGGQHYWR